MARSWRLRGLARWDGAHSPARCDEWDDRAAGMVPAVHRRRGGAWRARLDPPRDLEDPAGLTPLAAAGLVFMMIGATVIGVVIGMIAACPDLGCRRAPRGVRRLCSVAGVAPSRD